VNPLVATLETGSRLQFTVPVSREGRRVQQIAGALAPEKLRPDQLARRQRITRAALKASATSGYEQVSPHG
jgi:hypothetical protein